MDNVQKGLLYATLAAVLYAGMGGFAKALSESMSILEIMFFRSLLGTAIILYAIYKTPLIQSGGKLWLLLIRGVTGMSAMMVVFYTYANMPLGEAVTYAAFSTVFTAILAYFMLQEKLTLITWISIVLGFFGIAAIAQPEMDGFSYIHLVALIGAFLGATADTSIRNLKQYYDPKVIVLAFMLPGMAGPLLLMGVAHVFPSPELAFAQEPFILPDLGMCLLLAGLGIVSVQAQYLATKAFACSKAGVVSAIGYSEILFSIVLGVMLGDSIPDTLTFTGIALVMVSGIAIAMDNTAPKLGITFKKLAGFFKPAFAFLTRR